MKIITHCLKWRTVHGVSTLLLLFYTPFIFASSAVGLSKAKSVLESIKSELTTIIPIVAVIALLAFGLAYAAKFVEKEVFVRWAVGIIVAGSAAQITSLLFN